MKIGDLYLFSFSLAQISLAQTYLRIQLTQFPQRDVGRRGVGRMVIDPRLRG